MNCDHSGCDCSDATIERNDKHFCSQACATGTAAASASMGDCGCGHADCGRSVQKAPGARAAGAPGVGLSAPGQGAGPHATGSGSRADSTGSGRGSQADRDDQRASGMQAPARGDGAERS